MQNSYTAIYQQGHLDWLENIPQQKNRRVIVTFIETPNTKPITQAKTILQQAWGSVKKPHSITQIDADISNYW